MNLPGETEAGYAGKKPDCSRAVRRKWLRNKARP